MSSSRAGLSSRSFALLPAAPEPVFGLPADCALRWRGRPWLTVLGAVLRLLIVPTATLLAATSTLLVLRLSGWWPAEPASAWGAFWTAALLQTLVMSAVALAFYVLFARLLDKRDRLPELRWGTGLPLASGLAWGGVAVLACAAAIAALGGFSFQLARESLNTPGLLGYAITVGAGAGIAEEVLFRGVLLRSMEELLGTWAAVALSALAFGLIHGTNPHATWWSNLAIALEAGILLGLLYAATRSLWLVIGFHAAWNVVQGPVLGVPVSGTPLGPSLWRAQAHGADWLTGGAFGLEASAVTVVLLLAASVLLAVAVHRRGQVVAPLWHSRRTPAAPLRHTQAGPHNGPHLPASDR